MGRSWRRLLAILICLALLLCTQAISIFASEGPVPEEEAVSVDVNTDTDAECLAGETASVAVEDPKEDVTEENENLSVPDSTWKASEDAPYGLTYNDSNNEITITGCEVYDWDAFEENDPNIILEIPAEIDGKPVTTIGKFAFCECYVSAGLDLPDSITRIEEDAFSHSGFKGTLTLPANLTYIGDYAFGDCIGFRGDLSLPASLQYLGHSAFGNCGGFNGTLTLPAGLETIGNYAFGFCSGLTGELTLPANLKTIEGSAFANCRGLTGSLVLPDGVEEVGSGAFARCTGFTGTLSIPEGACCAFRAFEGCYGFRKVINNSFEQIFLSELSDQAHNNKERRNWINEESGENIVSIAEGTAVIEDDGAYKKYLPYEGATYQLTYTTRYDNGKDEVCITGFTGTSGGEFVIPDQIDGIPVTTIDDFAFFDSQDNGTPFEGAFVLPDTLTTIGRQNFYGKTYHKLSGELILPAGLKSIGYGCFYRCLGLTGDITIPDGVVSIDGFSDCSRLNGTVTIPASVKTIGPNFLLLTENVNKVVNRSSVPVDLTVISKTKSWINTNTLKTVTSIAKGTATVDDSVSIKTVLPQGIEDPAYELQYVVLNNREVRIVGTNSRKLEGVVEDWQLVIPEEIDGYPVTEIGSSAFQGFGWYGDIVLPDSVKKIGDWAFSAYGYWQDEPSVLTLPSDLKEIGQGAFVGCSFANEELVLPDGLKTISYRAFENAFSDLQSVIIPASVTFIGEDAFYGCYCGTVVNRSAVTCPLPVGSPNEDGCHMWIDEGTRLKITGITQGTAVYTEVNTAYSPEGAAYRFMYLEQTKNGETTAIIAGIYDDSGKYESVIEGDLIIPSSINGIPVTEIASHAMYQVKATGKLVLPDTLLTIGESAFYGATFDGDLWIPMSVTSLGRDAFAYCQSHYGRLMLSNSLVRIGEGAFRHTDFTGSLKLPSGLRQIEDSAFLEARFTNDLEIPEGVISIGRVAFDMNSFSGTLTIPASVQVIGDSDLYGYAFRGASFTKVVNKSAIPVSLEQFSYKTWRNLSSLQYVSRIAKGTAVRADYVGIDSIPDQIYTGAPIKPEIVLTGNSHNGVLGEIGYTVSYSNNTNVGIATATVTGKGDFADKITIRFRIVPRSLGEGDAFGDGFEAYAPNMQYNNGKELKSKPVIKLGSVTLKESKDYTVAYTGDLKGETDGKATVIVTGKGNFTGSAKLDYKIFKKEESLANATIAAIDPLAYTGDEIKPDLAVTFNGNPLTENDDFVVTYSNNINASKKAVATITGIGNYGGSKSVNFTITPAQLTAGMVEIDPVTYTGSAIKAEPAVTFNGTPLTQGKDFTVSYKNNTNVVNTKGDPTATIKGKGNFTGSVDKAFEIEPLEPDADELSVTVDNVKISQTGAVVNESVLKATVKYGKKTLAKNKDYVIRYTTAQDFTDRWQSATVTLIGNYTSDPIVQNFLIYTTQQALALTNANVTPEEGPFTYTGEKITPEILVKDGTKVLTLGRDYTLSYANNTNAAKANAGKKAPAWTVKGKGAYKGTVSDTFAVDPVDITDGSRCMVTVQDAKYNAGKAVKPKVVVVDLDTEKVLKEKKDYTVEFSNNTKKAEIDAAEKPTAVIKGIGNYAEELPQLFRIYEFDISTVTVDIEPCRYYGGQIKPAFTVYKDKKKTQVLDPSNYDVAYGTNVNVGNGTITLKGKGAYGGSATFKFKILPKQVSNLL
ncbi:MAG: leucine-rich repeat domain-containing protein [Lachnospiraceae bacterium]|nr:leucine-rich repeat domain-containing protein [Lachnospiraceae bacterium]